VFTKFKTKVSKEHLPSGENVVVELSYLRAILCALDYRSFVFNSKGDGSRKDKVGLNHGILKLDEEVGNLEKKAKWPRWGPLWLIMKKECK
jgi:hypothetical protein